ncbi:hypothetical protein MIR68_007320 [Amoeboaphelidium protococcarum]|nr:hypothetical protein MIR68_007320 [Amoeboaphelidium protococcarum]
MKVHESLRLYISDENFIIEPSYMDPSVLSENLYITRSSGAIRRNVPAVPTTQQETVMVIFGIIGTITLWLNEYLMVVSEREKVLNSQHYLGEVWRVKQVKLLPFNKLNRVGQVAVTSQVEYNQIRQIEHLFAQDHFYYSYDRDLSRSVQSVERPLDKSYGKMEHLWKQFDSRFFFNRRLCTKLIGITQSGQKDQDLSKFILPLLSGFVQNIQITLGGDRVVNLTLLSRRGVSRMGTRYFSRGIDQDGNVSNFVETEQILWTNDKSHVFSFVQIRGSIPLFWHQKINVKYAPSMEIVADASAAIRKHLIDLKKQYAINESGDLLLFNLVNSKGKEFVLAKEFKNQVELMKDEQFKYTHFDFHHECKNMQWGNIAKLFEKYAAEIRNIGYFSRKSGQVLRMQNGVVRTNCIDCLDRTNVVQSEVSKLLLTDWLRQLSLLDGSAQIQVALPEFMSLYRHMWADHADVISIMYSGTPALKTDFTRTGKRSWQGAVNDLGNSIARYVKNNFFDAARQDTLDLLTSIDLDTVAHRLVKPASLVFYALSVLLVISIAMLLSSLFGYQVNLMLWFAVLAIDVALIQKFGDDFVSLPTLVNPYKVHGSTATSGESVQVSVPSANSAGQHKKVKQEGKGIFKSLKSSLFGGGNNSDKARVKAM